MFTYICLCIILLAVVSVLHSISILALLRRRKFEDDARAAMAKFCERVETGEIKSKLTYASFCHILGRTPYGK